MVKSYKLKEARERIIKNKLKTRRSRSIRRNKRGEL